MMYKRNGRTWNVSIRSRKIFTDVHTVIVKKTLYWKLLTTSWLKKKRVRCKYAEKLDMCWFSFILQAFESEREKRHFFCFYWRDSMWIDFKHFSMERVKAFSHFVDIFQNYFCGLIRHFRFFCTTSVGSRPPLNSTLFP